MINIFENNDTMVIDGLSYEQMIELQYFVHRNIFDKFNTLYYYNNELKQVYQIVVEGSKRYRNMLRVLANNPSCLEDTIKQEPVPFRVPETKKSSPESETVKQLKAKFLTRETVKQEPITAVTAAAAFH